MANALKRIRQSQNDFHAWRKTQPGQILDAERYIKNCERFGYSLHAPVRVLRSYRAFNCQSGILLNIIDANGIVDRGIDSDWFPNRWPAL